MTWNVLSLMIHHTAGLTVGIGMLCMETIEMVDLRTNGFFSLRIRLRLVRPLLLLVV